MKCTQCGAQINLEDEFCPYCGALNQAARQHQADMKKYNAEFEETRSEVMSNVSGQIKSHSQLVALGIVIVLNILVIVCLFNGYEISDWLESRQINRYADSYVAELSAYEASGDYQSLNYCFRYKSLYQAKRGSELANFETVSDMAGYYSTIQNNFYYLTHPEVEQYQSTGDLLERIAEDYEYFEEEWDYMDSSYYKEQFEGTHLTAMKDMEERINTMFRSYGKFTDEDMEKLPDMGSQDIMILLGRRMGIYE